MNQFDFALLELKRQRNPFVEKEDKKLKELVEKFGDEWGKISTNMKGRNTRQCRERWLKYLNPNLNKSPWTKEEDDLLLLKYYQYGSKWKLISSFFANRTDLSIRNRYKKLQRRNKISFNQKKSEDVDLANLTEKECTDKNELDLECIFNGILSDNDDDGFFNL